MSWTSPRTWVASAILTAAQLNTDIRDNTLALYAALSGAAQGFGTQFYPTTDAAFYLEYTSSIPFIRLDSGDYFYFDRSDNSFHFVTGSAGNMVLDTNGKLTGKGFYDSGEVSIGSLATLAVNHGLAAKPRVVFGYVSATTGEVAAGTATSLIGLPGQTGGVTFTLASSTQVTLNNTVAATRYCRVISII